MGFRIGRKFANHTYPVPGGRGASPAAFARNSAQGPDPDQTVTGSAEVGWSIIEAGPTSGTSVPVVPLVTGILIVSGVIAVTNGSGATVGVSVQVGEGGTVVGDAPIVTTSIPTGDFAAIPFQTRIGPYPIGVAVDVNVFVSTSEDSVTLQTNHSTVFVQEVPAAA